MDNKITGSLLCLDNCITIVTENGSHHSRALKEGVTVTIDGKKSELKDLHCDCGMAVTLDADPVGSITVSTKKK